MQVRWTVVPAVICMWASDDTQDAAYPPAAGHDHPAGHAAASVIVGPRGVASQGLTDPLAVGVDACAFAATDSQMVQHGVKGHGALLSLQIALSNFRRGNDVILCATK